METKKKAGRPVGSKNKVSRAKRMLEAAKVKHTKAELIRKYATTFPNARPSEIARYYGYTRQYVIQVLWAWRKKNAGITPIKYPSELTKDEVEAHVKEHMKKHMKEHIELHKEATKDMVNNPPHYTQGGIETIDFIEAKALSYNLGNVVKYITRADHKGNKVEDLMKARWYLDREITNLTPPLP
jgi:hypothetical protein